MNYIVEQARQAILGNTDEKDLPLDYMGIFTKDEMEYENLERLVSTLGQLGDRTATPTGVT